MVRQHSEPYLWLLFSAGGVISAMLMPILVLLFGVAYPLGWFAPPAHEQMAGVLANPIVALALFGLCFLSLFHAAHRLRHTLADAVRLKSPVISILCYGSALVGTVAAAYLLLQVA